MRPFLIALLFVAGTLPDDVPTASDSVPARNRFEAEVDLGGITVSTTEIELGQTFELTVEAENDGTSASREGNISASFPDLDGFADRARVELLESTPGLDVV